MKKGDLVGHDPSGSIGVVTYVYDTGEYDELVEVVWNDDLLKETIAKKYIKKLDII